MAGSSKLREAGRGRALIVGGSMSGLLAALLLRRIGWDVDVFERVESELAGRGAGIVAQPDLIGTLRQLGIDPTDLGVEITTRKLLDASGRPAGAFECPQVLTAWERVYRALRDAFPPERYHRGCGVHGFVQTDGSVTAHLTTGTTAEGDMLVGADGLRSTVRQQCLPELTPLYAGYVAWRALIPESAFAPAIHRELFDVMTFCLPPGEQCLGYPVAGPDNDLRPGHPPLQSRLVPTGGGSYRTPATAYRRERHDPRDLDSSALDPAGGYRANAGCGRALARAAVPRDRAHDRRADPAADLRSRNST